MSINDTAVNPAASYPRPSKAKPSIEAVVKDKLRQDLRFLTFFISPNMNNFQENPNWFRETMRLTPEESAQMTDDLIACGLWVRDITGRIRTRHSIAKLSENGGEMTFPEFLMMASQILNCVSSKGNYSWGEAYTVVTSNEAKTEFLKTVNDALKKFLERSKSAPGETTFSWSHVALNTLAAIQAEETL